MHKVTEKHMTPVAQEPLKFRQRQISKCISSVSSLLIITHATFFKLKVEFSLCLSLCVVIEKLTYFIL